MTLTRCLQGHEKRFDDVLAQLLSALQRALQLHRIGTNTAGHQHFVFPYLYAPTGFGDRLLVMSGWVEGPT